MTTLIRVTTVPYHFNSKSYFFDGVLHHCFELNFCHLPDVEKFINVYTLLHNMKYFRFNTLYFLATTLLFFVEFLIGKYANDNFIRPYVGDYLIVIFLYVLLRAFTNISMKPATLVVLFIAYTAELLQYLNILDALGLRQSAIANMIMGNWFEWTDILAYSLGALTIVITERRVLSKESKHPLFI